MGQVPGAIGDIKGSETMMQAHELAKRFDFKA